jgi:hypothetical protein
MLVSGTPDSSDIWTGQLSGATYTPTTAPAITGTPDSSDIWTGDTSGAIYTPTSAPVAPGSFSPGGYVGNLVGLTNLSNLNGYPYWGIPDGIYYGYLLPAGTYSGFKTYGTSGTTLVFIDPTLTGPGQTLAVETGDALFSVNFNYHVIGQS